MEITRVGFGAWAAGGTSWGPQDDDASVAAIRRAVELGVNWVDTAPVYGRGHSEEIVARAVRGLPDADRPYVFTKTEPLRRDGEPFSSGDAAALRAGVENSLRRLGLECLDLLQFHWPAEDDVPLEEYWATLLALKAEGKAAHVGLSNFDVDQLTAAEAVGHVETLQPPFSAVQRESGGDVIPWCADHGTGVIVYSPMQAGLLTGAFTRERVAALPEGDWRRDDEDFTVGLDANLALAAALEPIAAKHGTSRAAVAVAWTLAWRGVTGAIVGGRSASQVDGWIDAAELVLDAEDLDDVAEAIAATGAGKGPARP
ncbi:MAG TPA: aldo/keto reductase [Candidatus Angelobacter sp.]|nr:aldo/keto reductase [Candidatus Angelobacter sp.]